MEDYKQSDVEIGDRVRRRGILAAMFGDEAGTVVAVSQGPETRMFEVRFGSRFVACSPQQIVRCSFPGQRFPSTPPAHLPPKKRHPRDSANALAER